MVIRAVRCALAFAMILTFVLVVPPAAHASDATKRITLALRQATLVQSMGAAACFAMGGIDTSRKAAQALEHADTYDTTLIALRDGHDWLGLMPVNDARDLAAIATATETWRGFRPAVYQIVAGDLHSVVMRQLMQDTDSTVDSSNALAHHFLETLDLQKVAADQQAAAQLAAHTRMLTQRALREMCLILFDLGGAEMPMQLDSTLAEIDAAFKTVSAGAAGVAPPNNARVARNLRTAELFWSKMRPTLEGARDNDTPDPIAVQKMLKLNKSVLKQLDQAIEGYFG